MTSGNSQLPIGTSGLGVLDVSINAARTAGNIVKERFLTEKEINYKGWANVVTDVDLESEKIIVVGRAYDSESRSGEFDSHYARKFYKNNYSCRHLDFINSQNVTKLYNLVSHLLLSLVPAIKNVTYVWFNASMSHHMNHTINITCVSLYSCVS